MPSTVVAQGHRHDCSRHQRRRRHKKVKGRKRHLLVDTEGFLITVVVTPANTGDRAAAETLFAAIKGSSRRLAVIWVDGG